MNAMFILWMCCFLPDLIIFGVIFSNVFNKVHFIMQVSTNCRKHQTSEMPHLQKKLNKKYMSANGFTETKYTSFVLQKISLKHTCIAVEKSLNTKMLRDKENFKIEFNVQFLVICCEVQSGAWNVNMRGNLIWMGHMEKE